MAVNIFDNAKAANKPLILDGAMGSLLQQKGFTSSKKSWMTEVNRISPESIISVHEGYIKSGADIITTNTFRTNPAAIGDIKRSKEEVNIAVSLAKTAAARQSVYIAGSNAPAEDCYQLERKLSKELIEINHYNHIDFLIDSGVDLILNETQSHWDEIEIICRYSYRHSIPFIISLYFISGSKLLSGEPLCEIIKLISDYGALAVGFNCIPANLLKILVTKTALPFLWGFYLNCGAGNPWDETIQCGISPQEYINEVENFLPYSPSFIGACCGSDFEHIKKIRELIHAKN